MKDYKYISPLEAFNKISFYNKEFKNQWDSGNISPDNYGDCLYWKENGVEYIRMFYKNSKDKEEYTLLFKD